MRPDPSDHAYPEKLALALQAEDLPRTTEVFKRQGEYHPVPKAGRAFDDSDPKRGSQSPLGGKVW